MNDLFDGLESPLPAREEIAPGAVLLRGRARAQAPALLDAVAAIAAKAPFRHMVVPAGFTMSAAMTNCGDAGWFTDRSGYRYATTDPDSGRPWPAMPEIFRALAREAAAEAGYPGFAPDACLINRYEPGARLSLHRDTNERDMTQPIVSVSLGLPATFEFGGLKRSDTPRRIALRHGDVAVWGGPARLAFHGIRALKDGEHELLGRVRINLTFRKAL